LEEKKMKPSNVILLGPAGAGKSSQVAQIHLSKNCDPITLGSILRAARFLHSPLGRRLKPLLDAGHLIDDETANTIVFAHILEVPAGRGFILDGYPRNATQAKELKKFLHLNKITITAIVELDVSDEIASERIHIHSQLVKKGISHFTDETDVAIDNRIKSYREEIDGVRAELKGLAEYVVIDAGKSINAVTLEILEHI
jgi:adenylate kinase